jgi:hypothetical protein
MELSVRVRAGLERVDDRARKGLSILSDRLTDIRADVENGDLGIPSIELPEGSELVEEHLIELLSPENFVPEGRDHDARLRWLPSAGTARLAALHERALPHLEHEKDPEMVRVVGLSGLVGGNEIRHRICAEQPSLSKPRAEKMISQEFSELASKPLPDRNREAAFAPTKIFLWEDSR